MILKFFRLYSFRESIRFKRNEKNRLLNMRRDGRRKKIEECRFGTSMKM